MILFSVISTYEKTKYRLTLKNVALKDAGEITFQCSEVKDSCKLTVKECMYTYLSNILISIYHMFRR